MGPDDADALRKAAYDLDEQKEWAGRLTEADARFLATRFGGRLAVRQEVRDGGATHVVDPRQFVGLLGLPSGSLMRVRPKVPVKNLFHMLAVAWRFPSPFLEEEAGYDSLDDVLEFVAGRFADLLEDRLRAGLYRAYVDREENLPAVRGKIDFARDLRVNHVLRHRTFCRFSDFTWDIPENQVLRQAVNALQGWPFRAPLRRRLRALNAQMAEVSETRHPASLVDGFTYHRLNEDYYELHRFCRLFLGGESLHEAEGENTFFAFLLDMNLLFEQFVTQILRDSRPAGTEVHGQSATYLDDAGKVRMRPDVVVKRDGAAVLVGDCKYKRLAPNEFLHHDLYQMLAYCTAMGLERGVLVYPVHTAAPGGRLQIRNSPVVIDELAIDLGLSLPEIKAECLRLTAAFFGT